MDNSLSKVVTAKYELIVQDKPFENLIIRFPRLLNMVHQNWEVLQLGEIQSCFLIHLHDCICYNKPKANTLYNRENDAGNRIPIMTSTSMFSASNVVQSCLSSLFCS